MTDLSTVDVPGKVLSVIFMAGCNFNCPFCQNSSIIPIDSGKLVEIERVAKFLLNNILIDGVSITGGEPTLQEKSLLSFCKILKSKKFFINVDSNASRPTVIEKLSNFVDKFSLDIKCSFPRYFEVARFPNENTSKIIESLKILNNSDLEFEVRTTVVPNLIDEEDIIFISKFLERNNFRGTYVLQQFWNSEGVREPWKSVKPPPRSELVNLALLAKKKGIQDIAIRTKEKGYERF